MHSHPAGIRPRIDLAPRPVHPGVDPGAGWGSDRYAAAPLACGEECRGNFPKTPAWKFSFVNHVTTSLFFVPTQSGMTDAAVLLGLPKPNWGSAADTAAGLIPRAMPSTNAFSP